MHPREALCALAAGRRGVRYEDLDAEQQGRVRWWASRMLGDGPTLQVRVQKDGTLTLWDISEPIAERVYGVDPVPPEPTE